VHCWNEKEPPRCATRPLARAIIVQKHIAEVGAFVSRRPQPEQHAGGSGGGSGGGRRLRTWPRAPFLRPRERGRRVGARGRL
jgi:hypothetical protein